MVDNPIERQVVTEGGFEDRDDDELFCLSDSVSEQEEMISQEIEEISFSGAEMKNRAQWRGCSTVYGVNYNIMTGDVVNKRKIHSVVPTGVCSSYAKQMYLDHKEEVDISDLCEQSNVGCSMEFGSICKINEIEDGIVIVAPESELKRLTTSDIQTTVCAVLNSRLRLRWLIGVERNFMVSGCSLTRCERDMFRQAVDFALNKEFIPSFDSSWLDLRFIPVFDNTENVRYVIEISIKTITDTYFQLSSGRVFYVMDGKIEQAQNINEVYSILRNGKKTEDAQKRIDDMKRCEKKYDALVPFGFGFICCAALTTSALLLRRYVVT